MSWDQIVESRIQDAITEGVFDGLPGAGEPLVERPEESLAGANWVGNKILRDAGALPEWLVIAREIERESEALAAMEARHAQLIAAAVTGGWPLYAPRIAELEAKFEAAARALRRKQDQWNYDAPAMSLERPAIWVEERVERLRARRRAVAICTG